MGKAMTLQEARRKGKAAERRGNGPPRLSTSELKLNRKVTEDRKWEIQNTLNEADAEITSSLQKVSDATGLKFDVVQSNVLARSLIKSQTRITSGYNHWTALQLANENKDKADGEKTKMNEFRARQDIKDAWKQIPKEEQDEFKRQGQEARAMKAVIPKIGHALQQTGNKTVQHIKEEIDQLYRLTGLQAALFVTRSKYDQNFVPQFTASGNLADYFVPNLNLAPLNLAIKMDIWALANLNGVAQSAAAERKQLQIFYAQKMKESLASALGVDKVRVNYKNFEFSTEVHHAVRLLGFPNKTVTAPSKTERLACEVAIAAFSNGTCRFVRLSPSQLDNYKQELAGRGNTAPVQKSRADGKKQRANTPSPSESESMSNESLAGEESDIEAPNGPPANLPLITGASSSAIGSRHSTMDRSVDTLPQISSTKSIIARSNSPNRLVLADISQGPTQVSNRITDSTNGVSLVALAETSQIEASNAL